MRLFCHYFLFLLDFNLPPRCFKLSLLLDDDISVALSSGTMHDGPKDAKGHEGPLCNVECGWRAA
jgi:hypothetical protein